MTSPNIMIETEQEFDFSEWDFQFLAEDYEIGCHCNSQDPLNSWSYLNQPFQIMRKGFSDSKI